MNKQQTDGFEKIIKSKWTWIVIILLITLGIGSAFGKAGATVPLEENKVSYKELLSEINNKEKELSSIEEVITKKQKIKSDLDKEKKTIMTVISNNQKDFDEAMEIIKNKDGVLAEIKSIEEQLASKNTEIQSLESTINTRKDDLAKVENLIVEKKDAPIQLSAGTYVIGSDVPPGRYKAVPVGRGSNFSTYDSDGGLDVNTILGNHGESEYIFFAFEKGIIQTESKVKLISVE